MADPNYLGARADRGFFGGGDPGHAPDAPGPDEDGPCAFAGHEYGEGGGGMLICVNCGVERWAEEGGRG